MHRARITRRIPKTTTARHPRTIPVICAGLSCCALAVGVRSGTTAADVSLGRGVTGLDPTVDEMEAVGAADVGVKMLVTSWAGKLLLLLLLLLGVVGLGVGTTSGPVPVGTIKVATMVECVLGAALVMPTHMLYDVDWACKFPSAPVQTPRLASAAIQATAPSPIVCPVFPDCLHRHASDGASPHALDSRLVSMNDRKHSWAHGGVKLRISADILGAASTTATSVVVHTSTRHSNGVCASLRSNISKSSLLSALNLRFGGLFPRNDARLGDSLGLDRLKTPSGLSAAGEM